MQPSKLSKFLGAGVIAVGLAVLPAMLPASAQTSGGSTGGSDAGGTYSTRQDRHTNYGWLGLIGLAGLAGLRRRHKSTTYRDPAYQDPTIGTRR